MHAWVPLLALALAAGVLALYWQVRTFEFVVYDDEMYITDNPHVRAGLSLDGLRWALTSAHVNWHPLTWLSHMLDCQLFGLDAGAHHLVNVLFHAANTVLLFLVLHRMTGGLWQSAFVAAFFGLHPLRVESVAWVSERKDVLSTFLWMLTLSAYCRYARSPRVGRWLAVALALTLGLLSKPMLVTLPFVLLLLDYWPLQRTATTPLRRLLWEKLPLFALVAAASVITVLAQRQMGAIVGTDQIPIQYRIENAAVAYVSYLRKMLWPADLAVFYPHPAGSLPRWQPITAAALLAVATVAALRGGRKHRYLVTGWLWYLGTLVPVIGLVQVGRQAMADRYSYIPLIGVSIIVAWGVPDLLAGWRRVRAWVAGAAVVALAALAATTWKQIGYWRDSVSLFEHALAVTEGNYVAHTNLGYALDKRGDLEAAAAQYETALRLWPENAVAHRNLGIVLDRQGRPHEALLRLTTALRIDPMDARTRNSTAVVLTKLGRIDEAAEHLAIALQLDPTNAKAHNNMGDVRRRQSRLGEAVAHFNEALRLNPRYARAHSNLGAVLAEQGDLAAAVRHLQEALRLDPHDHAARNNLARVLAAQQHRTSPTP